VSGYRDCAWAGRLQTSKLARAAITRQAWPGSRRVATGMQGSKAGQGLAKDLGIALGVEAHDEDIIHPHCWRP
jgi:hypothetical protein